MSTEGKLGRQVLYSRAHSTIFYSHSYTYSLSLSLSYLWQERGYIYISGTLTKRTLESRHPDPEASLHGQKNARAHDTRVTLVMNGIYSSGNIHYQKYKRISDNH